MAIALPPPTPQPLVAYWGFPPGALTPKDILARVSTAEERALRRMPSLLELVTVMANELAAVRATRAKSTPKSTTRRTRTQSREMVLQARLEHPAWTWQQVADEVGLSLRYVKQLGKEALAR